MSNIIVYGCILVDFEKKFGKILSPKSFCGYDSKYDLKAVKMFVV
jgi:hypothetical protein